MKNDINSLEDLLGRACYDNRSGVEGTIIHVWVGPKGGLRAAFVTHAVWGGSEMRVVSAPLSTLTIRAAVDLDPSLNAEEQSLARNRKTILAIKAYRERTQSGLREAKDAIYNFQDAEGLPHF